MQNIPRVLLTVKDNFTVQAKQAEQQMSAFFEIHMSQGQIFSQSITPIVKEKTEDIDHEVLESNISQEKHIAVMLDNLPVSMSLRGKHKLSQIIKSIQMSKEEP